ncbi:hypothetical protein B0H13DRAFT_1920949 [Mycena leptocephala]|nr:hypothetical protein B0H13DRAFT_1920949 [Mycena leptocephala]
MTKLSNFEATLITAPDALIIRLISFWTLADIVACDSLSIVFHDIIRYYKSLVWDPDSFFRPWFTDMSTHFRQVLGECGGVVSGSQITQFFDRTRYYGSDMDIFMRIGGLHHMGRWLQGQGYRYISASPASDYSAFDRNALRLSIKMLAERNSVDETIKGVFNYARYVASTTVVYLQKIQLIVVDTNPIHHVLFDFHSTAVINYMVADAVVSVFPIPTLILHKSYVVRSRTEKATQTIQWRTKYRDRGFRIIRKRTKGDHHDLILERWTGRMLYGRLDPDVQFDVLSWRSGVVRKDSFARIAEPGVWSLSRLRAKALKKYPGLINVTGSPTQLYRRFEASLWGN